MTSKFGVTCKARTPTPLAPVGGKHGSHSSLLTDPYAQRLDVAVVPSPIVPPLLACAATDARKLYQSAMAATAAKMLPTSPLLSAISVPGNLDTSGNGDSVAF